MAINQKPKQLFDLNIEDEAVRRNFDSLNRELQRLQSVQAAQPANTAWSEGEFGTYGGAAGIFRPPGLSLSITSRGNPVQLELVPSKVLKVGTGLLTGGVTSYVAARPPAGNDIIYFYHGIYRTTNGRETLLYKQLNLIRGAAAITYDATVTFSRFIDTTAPTGQHQYQFFVESFTSGGMYTSIGFYNMSLFAQEQ